MISYPELLDEINRLGWVELPRLFAEVKTDANRPDLAARLARYFVECRTFYAASKVADISEENQIHLSSTLMTLSLGLEIEIGKRPALLATVEAKMADVR